MVKASQQQSLIKDPIQKTSKDGKLDKNPEFKAKVDANLAYKHEAKPKGGDSGMILKKENLKE